MPELMSEHQFLVGLVEHLAAYLAGGPDLAGVVGALGGSLAQVLARYIRAQQLLPDDAEDLIAACCSRMREVTLQRVRRGDAAEGEDNNACALF
jgi:hypothetical protein